MNLKSKLFRTKCNVMKKAGERMEMKELTDLVRRSSLVLMRDE